MQWVHVVRKIDSIKFNVPISFIENYEETQIAINQEYNVFWSPDPKGTPKSFLKKKGKIPHINKIKRIPSSGWFVATVLYIAESEKQLIANLNKQRLPAFQDEESESCIVKKEVANESEAFNLNLLLEEEQNIEVVSTQQNKKRRIEEGANESDEYMSKAMLEFQTLKFKTVNLEKRNDRLIQIVIESNNKILELEELYDRTKEKLETALSETEKMNETEGKMGNVMAVLGENNDTISNLKELYEAAKDQLEVSLTEKKILVENSESLTCILNEKSNKILELEGMLKSAKNELESVNTDKIKMAELQEQVKALNVLVSDKNNKILELESYKASNDTLKEKLPVSEVAEIGENIENVSNSNQDTAAVLGLAPVGNNETNNLIRRIESLMQTLCENNDKCLRLEEQYKTTSNMLAVVTNENKKLKHFNFMLQEQLWDKSSNLSVSLGEITSTNEACGMPLACASPSTSVRRNEDAGESLPGSSVTHRQSNRLSKRPKENLSCSFSTPTKRTEDSSVQKRNLDLKLVSETGTSDEINTYLNADQLDSCERGSKFGQAGDSSFVKKLASYLWTPSELSERSSMGVPCPSQKGAKARRECTPKKKKIIHRLLKERILKERPAVDMQVACKRLSKCNQYLSSKIITVRRVRNKEMQL